MSKIKEIISKEAIDSVNKANDAIIQLEKSIDRTIKKIQILTGRLSKVSKE